MSDELFSSIESTLDIVWEVRFEDENGEKLYLDNMAEVMDSIVLQTVADGIINVVVSKDCVDFSIHEFSDCFISYFSIFDIDVAVSVDDNPPQILHVTSSYFPVTPTSRYVHFMFLGYLNCQMSLFFIDTPNDIPNNLDYPLVCIGFRSPDVEQDKVEHFARLTIEREFPITTLSQIVNKRVSDETRNQKELLHFRKMQKKYSSILEESSNNISKRKKQFEVLNDRVRDAKQTCISSKELKYPIIESMLERLENIVKDLSLHVEESTKELSKKKKPSYYNRKDELSILETLRKEVETDRECVDKFKENEM